MSSPYYNHPFWPSPRAARIAKLVLKKYGPASSAPVGATASLALGVQGPVKPAGRLTHDKALKVMADNLGLTVHEFLHVQPADAILRLKLADTEQKAWSILGNTTLPPWWQWGGWMPCCERTAPCRETTAASTTQAPASGELIETLMEFLKEMNGIVTAGDQRYVTALVQRFKGRVV